MSKTCTGLTAKFKDCYRFQELPQHSTPATNCTHAGRTL